MTPLRLGTRGSRLAHAQAALAAEALREAGLGPVAIVPISTAGDRDRRSAFSELGARGVFSKELEDALLEGRIDVAVHSAKDLTTDETPGLALAAVLPRADARDAWCGPHASLAEVPQGARVGTASMRRGAQLRSLRPDLARREPARQRGHAPAQAHRARPRRRACSRPAGSIASSSRTRSGSASRSRRCCPRPGRASSPCRRAARTPPRWPRSATPAARRCCWPSAPAPRCSAAAAAPRWPRTPWRCPGGELWLRAWLALPDGSQVVEAEARGADPEALAGEVAARGAGSRGRGDRRGGARVTVYLVGAGPGDPGLITARGAGAPAARRRGRLRPPRRRRAARPRAGRAAC